jgi:protoporphyrinogen oxidase
MLILGGGVAGLAASLATGAPVYEAGDATGGVARSKEIDGFVFDYGIHVLQTKHSVIHALFKDLGISLCTRRRNAMIYSNRTYTAYPFQVNTAGLPIGLRARCLWKYFRRNRQGRPANYQEWVYQNLGEGYGDTFLIPYSEKFWTVHPSEMTSEWVRNRIPPTNPWQMLRGAVVSRQTRVGTNAVFQYPDEGSGFGAIPARMSEAVSEVHLKHRATRIDVTRRLVEFNDGAVEVPYDTLISTIPLPTLVSLIPEAPEAVRGAAGLLRSNSILVVNLGLESPNPSPHHWVHFPEPDVSFFRISYPHNLGPGMVPAGRCSVAAEVAYSDRKPIDKTTIVDRVIDDLLRVGAIGRGDRIVLKDTIDIRHGYVIYDRNRKAAVRTIRDWLESASIFATGRYGLWAYLWSHESIMAGRQLGRRLVGRRTVPDISRRTAACGQSNDSAD